MKTIDLKTQVQQAVAQACPAFAAAHPNLAAILDETLLVEEAARRLPDDPDYQRALADAQFAGQTAQTLTDFIDHFVHRWLKELL